MRSAPRIGFVVPVFRPPAVVFDAMLRSIEAQSMPDWECILVDDGSDDPALSRRLLAASEDERFRVIVAPENGGIAAATNLGLEALRAPVFALADHDDLLSSNAAETVLALMDRDPSVGVVYSDESTVDDVGAVIATHRKPDFSPIRLEGQHYLNHLMAARTELIGDLRVRTEYEPTQDLDFVVRLIAAAERNGQRVAHLPGSLYGWRAIVGSSAASVAEKPGMVNAAYRSFEAELERRGVAVEIANAVAADGHLTASCLLNFPPVAAAEIDLIPIGDGSDVAAIIAAVASGDRRFAALVPDLESGPSDWVGVVASEAARAGVGAAGPCVVDSAGRVVSIGRIVVPTLGDLFAGLPLDDGPFGANQVTREVSALHPAGLVLDRQTFAEAGIGFDVDPGRAWSSSLDVMLAGWGVELQRRGYRLVWTPRARLVVATPPVAPFDTAWDAWVDANGQPAEHFSPAGSAPASLARRSRARRLLRATKPGATFVVTADAAADSPPIADAVDAAAASGSLMVRVGGSLADRQRDSRLDGDRRRTGDAAGDLGDAISAAVEGQADHTAAGKNPATDIPAAVVIAGTAAEFLSDPRLVEPLLSGGVEGGLDGVALVPVTPYPWPDWLRFESDAGVAVDRADEVATFLQSWLFRVGPSEPDPNVQIGAALGPIAAVLAAEVIAFAQRCGLEQVVFDESVRLLGVIVERAAANPETGLGRFEIQLGDGTSDSGGADSLVADSLVADSLVVGWDSLDRESIEGRSMSIVEVVTKGQGATAAVVAGIDEGEFSTEQQQLLQRFLGGVGFEADDDLHPGLAATRRVAVDFAVDALTASAEVAGATGAVAATIDSWPPYARHLLRRVLTVGVGEVNTSIALWWDRRFDGPIPRWVTTPEWRNEFAVANSSERGAMAAAVAGAVPDWLALRLLETRRPQLPGETEAMLATFERGREVPVDDQRVAYRPAPGPVLHRYRARQSSLRAVAFSAANASGRVALQTFRLQLTGKEGRVVELDLGALLDGPSGRSGANINWIDTCPIGERAWLQRAGGQLVIELNELGAQLEAEVGRARNTRDEVEFEADLVVELEVEFRYEYVEPDNPAFVVRFERAARSSTLDAAEGGGLLTRLKRRVRR